MGTAMARPASALRLDMGIPAMRAIVAMQPAIPAAPVAAPALRGAMALPLTARPMVGAVGAGGLAGAARRWAVAYPLGQPEWRPPPGRPGEGPRSPTCVDRAWGPR